MSDTKNTKEKTGKPKRKTLVLLDAHAILHRAYHALPDFMSTKGEPTGALYGFCTLLLKLIKDIEPDYIAACYDLPEPTMRHQVYGAYKAGRQETDEALVLQLERSKDICVAFNIPIYSSPGFEADDMLGTIVEQTKDNADLNIVIASGDMDTLQLVSGDKVRVYTLKKGIKDTIVYNEDAVKERFGFGPELLPDYKGLRGDPSDNIIGIKGIGEKTAEILIGNFGTIEEMYEVLEKHPDKFEKVGVKGKTLEKVQAGKEEALFSKMLATIRRDGPIHFTLPETEWIPGVDQEKIITFLSELDFRGLRSKVAEAFSFTVSAETATASPEDTKTAQLMMWVIDPSKANPTIDDMLSYTKTNTVVDAIKAFEKIIKDQGLTYVWEEIEMPLIPMVREMQEVGIAVDTDVLKKLSEKHHKTLGQLEAKIWKEAGEEFNIASPKQLGEMLFNKMGIVVKGQKKNASGGFSTKESELEKMKEEYPIAGYVLEYRELAKLLGTYIDTIPQMVDETSRLHAAFIQNGAVTGRMSSANPNLQNIPNKTDLGREIRTAFVAKKGSMLMSFDYSQIELRIAAFLSKDQNLIEIFRTGQDVHTEVASRVFGVPAGEVTKTMRSHAKTINFGVMYGMGVNALRANMNVGKEEAQEFLDGYFNTFSGLAEYLEKVKRETMQKGYTETFFGRRRYFPEIHSKLPFMKAQAERMAINAPIQGTEADVIKLAMIQVREYLKKEKLDTKVSLLLQVHDELVYEVEKDLVEKIAPVIKNIMESVIDPKKTEGVVCVANASVGDSWAEMKTL
ncbi:MAG: DNA polymerase [Candidatus Zambryskibacteria bacterium]|nr:DNA polymerase [Candidatus Zambryskibacteria bacterium]